jgi:hypothetical protein
MTQRIATPLIQRTQEPSHAVELKLPIFRRTFRLGLQEHGGTDTRFAGLRALYQFLIMEYKAGRKEISFDLRPSRIRD